MSFRTFISIILAAWCIGQIGCLSWSHDSAEDTVDIAALMEMPNALQSDNGLGMAAAETFTYQGISQSAKRSGGHKWNSMHYSHTNTDQGSDEAKIKKMIQHAPWKPSSHHCLISLGKLII